MMIDRLEVICMPLRSCLRSLGVMAAITLSVQGRAHGEIRRTDLIRTPDVITSTSGETAEIERGLIFVPENRRNPDSRLIAVQFILFPALERIPGASPVFWLPGGRGYEVDFTTSHTVPIFNEIQRLRRYRDVVYVSQRGYPRAPGLTPELWLQREPLPLDEPETPAAQRDRERSAFQRALQYWSRRGVDLSGYDMLNAVDDLYDLRAALGYHKIILRGVSFSSQLSIAYIKRHADTVDRALLSAIEPISYAYESPRSIWACLRRIAEQAEADPDLAPSIPRGGLLLTIQRLIEQLDAEPVRVAIPGAGHQPNTEITVGGSDLRQQIANIDALPGNSRRERLSKWPRFVIELDHGDYRYLAAKRLEGRVSTSGPALVGPLIDHSVGISSRRDSEILGEPEARWLGDINARIRNVRDLLPTLDVGDQFRENRKFSVPVLFIDGDLDWFTPIENAHAILPYFENSHLLEVRGGTHGPDQVELPQLLPAIAQQVFGFIDADLTRTAPQAYFNALPSVVTLPRIHFEKLDGPSLYEQWRAVATGGG
jgi:pimeloyl-ACP methyl ester carboxylesterase